LEAGWCLSEMFGLSLVLSCISCYLFSYLIDNRKLLLLVLLKRNWFKWRLTIKTVTGALYKVFMPNVQSRLLCTEQCNVRMSKVSRRTVDTVTSLVAYGMGAKTLQFWPTQADHSRPVTQPLGTHGRRDNQCVCDRRTKMTTTLSISTSTVNTKVNRLYRKFMLRINFLFILRKSVNFSVILSFKRKMNSTTLSSDCPFPSSYTSFLLSICRCDNLGLIQHSWGCRIIIT